MAASAASLVAAFRPARKSLSAQAEQHRQGSAYRVLKQASELRAILITALRPGAMSEQFSALDLILEAVPDYPPRHPPLSLCPRCAASTSALRCSSAPRWPRASPAPPDHGCAADQGWRKWRRSARGACSRPAWPSPYQPGHRRRGDRSRTPFVGAAGTTYWKMPESCWPSTSRPTMAWACSEFAGQLGLGTRYQLLAERLPARPDPDGPQRTCLAAA